MREEQALLNRTMASKQAEEKVGLERGRAEGIEKGREEGIEQGLERGTCFRYGPSRSDFRGRQPAIRYDCRLRNTEAAHENEPRLAVPSCHGRR